MAKNRYATDSAVYAQYVGVTYFTQSPDGDITPYSFHTSMEHFMNVYNHVNSLPDLLEHFQPTWHSMLKDGFESGDTDSEEFMNAALHYLMTDDIAESGLNAFADQGVGYFVTLNPENCSKPSATASTFSDWLDLSGQMLFGERDYETQFYEGELTVIRSPESKLKEDMGQEVNMIAICAWIFDEENEVHNRIFKCSRDVLELGVYMKEFTPEYQKMLSLTSETMILEVLKGESEPMSEMDFYVMLIEHLALHPETKLFLDANPDCDINFHMSVNSQQGESTQVYGLRTDELELDSMD